MLGSVLRQEALATEDEAAPPRVFVFDSREATVRAIDMANGTVLGAVGRDRSAQRMLRAAGDSRIVVLDEGDGSSVKSSATVIDAVTVKLISRVDLAWGLDQTHLSHDGKRLTAVCPGQAGPDGTRITELVTIDLTDGGVAGRVALSRRAAGLLVLPGGEMAVAYFSTETSAGSPTLPAQAQVIDLGGAKASAPVPLEATPSSMFATPDGRRVVLVSSQGSLVASRLQFLDLASGRIASTLEFGGHISEPTFSPDGRFLYILAADRIEVVSLESLLNVRSVEGGLFPRLAALVDRDGGQVLVLSDEASSTNPPSPSKLRFFRDGELMATLSVPPHSRFGGIAPGRRRLYLQGEDALIHVDLAAATVLGSTHLRLPGPKHAVSDLVFAWDTNRAFVAYYNSTTVSVLDLDSPRLVREIKTGRGGVRFAKHLGAVAAFALSVPFAVQGLGYSTYWPSPAKDAKLVVRPDGQYAYALNTQTHDVAVIEASSGRVVERISARGSSLMLPHQGRTLAVVDGNKVTLIDTATNKKAGESVLKDAPVLSLFSSPDAKHILTLSGGVLYCLDASTARAPERIPGTWRADALIVETGE